MLRLSCRFRSSRDRPPGCSGSRFSVCLVQFGTDNCRKPTCKAIFGANLHKHGIILCLSLSYMQCLHICCVLACASLIFCLKYCLEYFRDLACSPIFCAYIPTARRSVRSTLNFTQNIILQGHAFSQNKCVTRTHILPEYCV